MPQDYYLGTDSAAPVSPADFERRAEENARRAALRDLSEQTHPKRGLFDAPAWFSGITDDTRPRPLSKDLALPTEQAAQREFAERLATPATPTAPKPAAPAETYGLPKSWTDTFDAHDAAERPPIPATPAAPAKPASFIRYKDRNGEWKDYAVNDTLTGNRPEAPRSEDTQPQELAWDDVTRQHVPVNRVADAGFTPSADVERLPIGQRPPSYFEDEAKKSGVAEMRAQRALAERLQADPFAKERESAAIDVGKQGAVAGIQSGLRQAEERQRQQGYINEVKRLAQLRDAEVAKVSGLPPNDPKRTLVEQRAQAIYDEEQERLKESYGFGARLGQAVR